MERAPIAHVLVGLSAIHLEMVCVMRPIVLGSLLCLLALMLNAFYAFAASTPLLDLVIETTLFAHLELYPHFEYHFKLHRALETHRFRNNSLVTPS
jgi:hypothetical protein